MTKSSRRATGQRSSPRIWSGMGARSRTRELRRSRALVERHSPSIFDSATRDPGVQRLVGNRAAVDDVADLLAPFPVEAHLLLAAAVLLGAHQAALQHHVDRLEGETDIGALQAPPGRAPLGPSRH